MFNYTYNTCIGLLTCALALFATNVFAEKNLPLDMNTLEPLVLNAKSVYEVTDFPIFFEGNLYQPEQYVDYFEDGLEITLYFILESDDEGQNILYAFNTVEEAEEYISINSIVDTEENSYSKRTVRGKSCTMGCKKPTGWYLFWEHWYRPHNVFSFSSRPAQYEGCMINIRKCVKWGKWKGIPYCKKKGKKKNYVVKADAFPNNSTDVMVQARDIAYYCSGNPWTCKSKHFRICN